MVNDQGALSEKSYDALEMAKLFRLFEQNDSAISYAEESLQIAIEHSLYQQVANACYFLSDYYEKDDPLKALQFSKMAIISKDSLEEMRTMKGFTDLIDFDEQQRQEEMLAAEEEFKNQLRMNALLGSSFTLFVVAIFLYRNNRLKQRSKQKVEVAYERLKTTQARLIHAEKMASLGELTAGIAHEIQNPLNFVNNFSDVNQELLDELSESIKMKNWVEVEEILQNLRENENKVMHHGRRAEEIVRSMLLHSRGNEGEKEHTDINALCDEYLRLAYHGFRANDKTFNVHYELDLDESLPKIEVVPQDIGRVLLNLINNAFQAVAGVEQPKVTVATKKLNGKIMITVTDNGPGIPDNIRDKIFQPFFTTKPSGQGTGLGLSLAYDIVKGHGGRLNVAREESSGTVFSFELPLNEI